MTGADQPRKPILGRGTLLFLRIWLGIITVVTVVLVVLSIRELVDPSSDGQPGTVVITNCNVDHTYRRCYGNFTASGGGLTLTNAQVFGEEHGTVGATLHGYGDSTDRTITVASGAEDFTDVYIAAVFLVIWAGMSYFLVYRPLRRRRRARRPSTGSARSTEN